MRIAYLDCFAGIAGDMLMGALVDAGVPRSVLEEATLAMGLGASLRFETVDRSGISATKVHVFEQGRLAEKIAEVTTPVQEQPAFSFQPKTQHRHKGGHAFFSAEADSADVPVQSAEDAHGRSLVEIRQILQQSALMPQVKRLAIEAFELLGASEAKIHNVPVSEIHFHEVGAVDAIVDIVASAAGIVHLDVEQWYCSPVNVGSGTVRCAHGLFPVPAPATADLLRGVPTYSAGVQKELTTPTGAALLRALSPSFGPQPGMRTEHIGYGAGTRNPAGFPNVLRLSIGEKASRVAQEHRDEQAASDLRSGHELHAGQDVDVLETALDDLNPQILAHVAELVLRSGALDVMLTPVVMKKGRPGTLLTVLANPKDTGRFEQILLRETTTLGIRIRQERRVCLERSHTEVETEFGSVRLKVGSLGGQTLNVQPEFEDCRRIAEETGLPLKKVHAAAVAAYASQQSAVGRSE